MKLVLKLFIVVLFFISAESAFSQDFPSEIWHNGKVVLINGDTVKGDIKYDFQNDLIQLNANGILKTYGARKLFYFDIFDEMAGGHRYFYSLPYKVHSDYETPILFEVLFEGNISLLAREEIVTENVSASQYNYYYYPMSPYNNYTRERLAYKFYFLEEGGEIRYYNLKKNDLLAIFGKHSKQINQYMKKNRLKHDELRDLVRITSYYNAIVGS